MMKHLIRTYIIFVFLLILSTLIVYRLYVIQIKEGEYWISRMEKNTLRLMEIEAIRGNIFDASGNLLATSVPYYEVGFDVNVPSVSEEEWKSSLDSLCTRLSMLFKDKSPGKWKKEFLQARNSGDRFVLIRRNVTYKQLGILKTFPLFRKGRKGGLVILQYGKRERPFRLLAARTIGYSRPGIKPVGLEGAYDSILRGINGKRLMQKIAADVWKPLNDKNEVDPRDGYDLVTTLDINIQDVAEKELMNALEKNHASHGCAVLMEVKTGAIKAIANLTRTEKKDTVVYEESMNYAVGYPSESGSTFKLASFLALFEEYGLSLYEKVEVGNGECRYYDRVMKDAHPPKTSTLTLCEVFEQSSNVGTSKIVTKYFQKNPERFVWYLNRFHLANRLGLEVPGEGIPRIKKPGDRDWYGTTLPWMSIGYESLITPMQLLTLYNAVANNGCMVKPRFVSEIRMNGRVLHRLEPEVLDSQIVSKETVRKAKEMMEKVVERGTGKAVQLNYIKVGGKTGTAQIARKGNYKAEGVLYQASFVGYFPAENPLYTCIVIINSPSNGIYYGGLVAAPVFKEIASKVWSTDIQFHTPINLGYNSTSPARSPVIPETSVNKAGDITGVLKFMGYHSLSFTEEDQLVLLCSSQSGEKVQMQPMPSPEKMLNRKKMPDLRGFTADKAVYLLENGGYQVMVRGSGWVIEQKPEPGTDLNPGQTVVIRLGT